MILATPFNNSECAPLESGEFCILAKNIHNAAMLLGLEIVASTKRFVVAKSKKENLRYLISEE